MRKAKLTNHATERIEQRCQLTNDQLKALIDAGAAFPIGLASRFGMKTHKLVYSIPDDDWFIVIQDVANGVIVTVMPLEYLKDRIIVTAAMRRSAKSQAQEFERTVAKCASLSAAVQSIQFAVGTSSKSNTWRIEVWFKFDATIHVKAFQMKRMGTPLDRRTNPQPLYDWLREKLVEREIPIETIVRIMATHAGHPVVELFENFPMTDDEILRAKAIWRTKDEDILPVQ